jgi:AraC-like DNA-binding protein
MALASQGRRIDWKTMGESTPRARLLPTTGKWSRLAKLVAELADDPSEEATDRFLRDAVEFARRHLGIERCGIYRLNTVRMMMVGTWGTGAQGETVDEHDLAYAFGDVDREVFGRAQAGVLWSVFDDCPLIAQVEGETRLIGRGWVACTAIRGPRQPLGTLFNDSAITGSPVNEAVQSRAAILCCVLAQVLERRRQPVGVDGSEPGADHPLVQRVTDLLSDDPTLSCAALARQLRVSAGRLARTFKSEARVSVVEHRNELRLARFLDRADVSAHNLAAAAIDAGFGSYAQFHRVFCARFGRPPREYLLERAATRDPHATGAASAAGDARSATRRS